jgi:S-adenosylmethionine hydrolase
MNRKERSTKARNKSARGVIALLTDFGDRDHYVGSMKGVILSINPRTQIVDISHNVSPQNVEEAGYLLWASFRSFPDGTVFACVVDPGVGSGRKIVCVETVHYRFIAPDNGLLDLVILEEEILRSYEIAKPPRLGSKPISATFHGRDIFAPLAAFLSSGKSVGQFGIRCDLKKPSPVFYEPKKGVAAARILHIDRFGNLITNIPGLYFDRCTLKVGTAKISERIRSYAEAPQAHPCMIVGSSGLIEVVLKEGNASEMLHADLRTPVVVLEGGQSLRF